MVGNHNSSDNRLKAIEYYLNNDISQEKISEIFKISRRTFIKWCDINYAYQSKYARKYIEKESTKRNKSKIYKK